MEKRSAKDKVVIQLPVKIDYRVLNSFLQKKFQGKILSKGKANGETSDRARILKIALQRSQKEEFDLLLELRLQLLTTFFRNKEIEVDIHLALSYDAAYQEVYIKSYEVEGENNGWFTNTLVETLINTFLYDKIRKKMKVDLQPVIEKQLSEINTKLYGGQEVKEGVFLSGRINDLRVTEIIPGHDHLLVSVSITGNNVLDIKQIKV
jgi:hypothetical protein